MEKSLESQNEEILELSVKNREIEELLRNKTQLNLDILTAQESEKLEFIQTKDLLEQQILQNQTSILEKEDLLKILADKTTNEIKELQEKQIQSELGLGKKIQELEKLVKQLKDRNLQLEQQLESGSVKYFALEQKFTNFQNNPNNENISSNVGKIEKVKEEKEEKKKVKEKKKKEPVERPT